MLSRKDFVQKVNWLILAWRSGQISRIFRAIVIVQGVTCVTDTDASGEESRIHANISARLGTFVYVGAEAAVLLKIF